MWFALELLLALWFVLESVLSLPSWFLIMLLVLFTSLLFGPIRLPLHSWLSTAVLFHWFSTPFGLSLIYLVFNHVTVVVGLKYHENLQLTLGFLYSTYWEKSIRHTALRRARGGRRQGDLHIFLISQSYISRFMIND